MRNLEIAESIIRDSARMIEPVRLREMKYKAFCQLRNNIRNALMLMDSETFEPTDKPFPERELIAFFDKYYPQWRTLSRSDEARIPRQVLQYLLTVKTDLSLKAIGQLTMGKDHTTIIHSKQTVKDALETFNSAYMSVYSHAVDTLRNANVERLKAEGEILHCVTI